MERRGVIVINYLVMLVLALIVLAVVLIFFTKGFGSIIDKFRSLFSMILSWRPSL